VSTLLFISCPAITCIAHVLAVSVCLLTYCYPYQDTFLLVFLYPFQKSYKSVRFSELFCTSTLEWIWSILSMVEEIPSHS